MFDIIGKMADRAAGSALFKAARTSFIMREEMFGTSFRSAEDLWYDSDTRQDFVDRYGRDTVCDWEGD